MDNSGDVIYIDVLLVINLAINFFLLLAAARLCGRSPKRSRILLGAAIGAIYSLVILLPDIPWPIQTALRVGVCLLMMFAVEGRVKFVCLLRDSLVFFTVSFIFAGFMLAVRMFIAPAAMIYSNGVVYLRVSALTLIIATIAAYLLTELFFRIFRRRTVSEKLMRSASVTVVYRGLEIETPGFVDTGNLLRDPLSGAPVIIAGAPAAQKLFPQEVCVALTSPIKNAGTLGAGTVSGFRLIPYSTVSGKGLVPVFRPDRITVSDGTDSYLVEDAFIGFPSVDGELLRDDAVIINPEILTRHSAHKSERTKTPC